MAKASTEVPETPKSAKEQMMILLDQIKLIKPQAILEMEAEREELTQNLIILGHDPNPKPGISKVNCRVCNSPDHDARYHKGDTPAQKEKLRKAAFG